MLGRLQPLKWEGNKPNNIANWIATRVDTCRLGPYGGPFGFSSKANQRVSATSAVSHHSTLQHKVYHIMLYHLHTLTRQCYQKQKGPTGTPRFIEWQCISPCSKGTECLEHYSQRWEPHVAASAHSEKQQSRNRRRNVLALLLPIYVNVSILQDLHMTSRCSISTTVKWVKLIVADADGAFSWHGCVSSLQTTQVCFLLCSGVLPGISCLSHGMLTTNYLSSVVMEWEQQC